MKTSKIVDGFVVTFALGILLGVHLGAASDPWAMTETISILLLCFLSIRLSLLFLKIEKGVSQLREATDELGTAVDLRNETITRFNNAVDGISKALPR
jgi:hypothetical protein